MFHDIGNRTIHLIVIHLFKKIIKQIDRLKGESQSNGKSVRLLPRHVTCWSQVENRFVQKYKRKLHTISSK